MVTGTLPFPTVAPWPGPDDGDEGRQTRGLAIAATHRIDKIRAGYRVPSQSSGGHYTVVDNGGELLCSCPDFEQRSSPCKHVYAVQYRNCRENADGAVSDDTQVLPAKEPDQPALWRLDAPLRQPTNRAAPQSIAPARGQISPATAGKSRPTYGQNWPAYNPAQRNQKSHFRHLLKSLSVLAEGRAHPKGRKPYLWSDQIFSLVYKVYIGKSWRVYDTDLREAQHNGFIQETASTSSLARFMGDPSLTPILHDLLLCSAMPMQPFEKEFAIDATGFSSDRFARWFAEKWGGVKEVVERDWVKLHLVCGATTKIITSAEVSDHRHHDIRYFEQLMVETAEHFDVKTIAADKAYSSRKNYTVVEGLGGVLLSPFKSNAVQPRLTDQSEWAVMYHWFMTDYEGWANYYHRRSIVEAAIGALKKLFGDRVDSRNPVAQANELLCRLIAYNIIVLIHAVYERGLEVRFQSMS